MTTPTITLSDGSTTVTLSSGNLVLEEYDFQSGKWDPATGIIEAVTETMTVVLTGTTTQNSALIASVERLFRQAADTLLGISAEARVYLNITMPNDASAWRSRLYGGQVVIENEGIDSWSRKPRIQLSWEREGCWSGARTQLPLTNSHGTNNTTGLAVYNCNDASYDNYVDIAAGSVVGSIPAPVEIRMQNTTGGNQLYTQFVWAADWTSPTISFALEGEAGEFSVPTVNALATASGGNVGYWSLTANTPRLISWPLLASWMSAGRGGVAHVLGLLSSSPPSDLRVRLSIRDYYNIVELWKGGWLSWGPQRVGYLGTVRVPPVGFSTGWSELNLMVELVSPTTSGISIDHLQLMPVGSFRFFEQRGMIVLDDDWVVDDGIEGITYLIEGGTYHPIYNVRTQPLLIAPNKAQRLRFMVGASAVTGRQQTTVQMYYRPRRLSL